MRLNIISPNQIELITKQGIVLFSYETPVAANLNLEVYKTNQYFSNTTSRHINSWLNGRLAEEMPQEFFDNLLERIK